MSENVTWKKGKKVPHNITDIASIGKGWINQNFNLGVLRSIRRTGGAVYFEFEIRGKKITRYEAWSSLNSENGNENIEMLEEHHSYLVKGQVKAMCKSPTSDGSSRSNYRYKIFLGKITVLSKSAAPWSKNKVLTLATLRRDFTAKNYGQFEMKDLKITGGEMYRYRGCERCHKKISEAPNRWGKYSCSKCKLVGGLNGRICTIARNVQVGDGTTGQNGKLFGLVIYHDVVESILGKEVLEEICNSFTDTKARQVFQKLIGGNFDGVIVHQMPQRGSKFGSTIFLKDVLWKSPPISITPTAELDAYADNDDDDNGVGRNNERQEGDMPTTEDTVGNKIICKICNDIEDTGSVDWEYDDDDTSNLTNANQNEVEPTTPIAVGNSVGNGNFNSEQATESDEGVESGLEEIETRLGSTNISGAYLLAGSKAGSGHYGLALIININSIVDWDNPQPRTGSQKDVKALEKLFPELKIDIFQGRTIHNPKLNDFPNLLQQFKSELIKKDYRSCFVVYMGHGQHYYVKLGDDERINVYKDIMWQFAEENFNEFRNRPKIFILAACQNVPDGRKGFDLETSSPMAHMLWVTPCRPGQRSPRDPRFGTYFIRTLVKCLRIHKRMELTDILKIVQQEAKRTPIEGRGFFIPDFCPSLFSQFFFPFGQ